MPRKSEHTPIPWKVLPGIYEGGREKKAGLQELRSAVKKAEGVK